MADTYFIRIKKDYAASVIEDLQKMDAVELITDDNITIPEWQINLVREEREKIENDPSLLQDWNTVKQKIKRG